MDINNICKMMESTIFRKWLDEHDKQIRSDEIEKFIKNVLTELNDIAENNDYCFGKDNSNLVSTVLYGQFELLKEQK